MFKEYENYIEAKCISCYFVFKIDKIEYTTERHTHKDYIHFCYHCKKKFAIELERNSKQIWFSEIGN